MSKAQRLGAKSDGFISDFIADLQPRVHAYFVRRLPRGEAAGDATSETFLVLWRRRDEIPADQSEAVPYAFGVARLVLKNFQRQSRRKFERHVPLDDATLSVGDDPIDSRLDIESALQKLKPADRELITLVHWDGLSIAEAGQSLGHSPAVAYRRHRNALYQLRVALESAEEAASVFPGLISRTATGSSLTY